MADSEMVERSRALFKRYVSPNVYAGTRPVSPAERDQLLRKVSAAVAPHPPADGRGHDDVGGDHG